ncbi:MAG TPA: helical backbone metal receptor [Gemmatimonadaceae bacterium]|nr:helical backbone metal receptor [Gemmatimonadaceae bacterium]
MSAHSARSLALLLLLAACGRGDGAPAPAAAAVQVVDDLGDTVRLARPATRIVSLAPGATDLLVTIGAADRIVGRTVYDTAAALRHLPVVGGGLDPSLEVLVGLRPDVVIGWKDPAGRTAPRLADAGIAYFNVAAIDTTALFANLRRFGVLTGLAARGDSLAASIRAELAEVRRSVAGRERPTVLFVAEWSPPMTGGPGTLALQLVGAAGGRSAFPELTQPSPSVSLEAIVRRQPDYVLSAYGDRTPAEELRRLRAMPGWRELRAVREGRVVLIHRDLLNRNGPAVGEAARLIRDALHPGAAPR